MDQDVVHLSRLSPWQTVLINLSSHPRPAAAPAQGFHRLPVPFTWKSVRRCKVDGSSFSRKLSCRLKGEFFWLNAGKPRKEPWRTSCSRGAWRRGMAAAVVPAATGVPASPFSPGDVVAGVGDTCPGWAGPGAAAGAAAASARDTGLGETRDQTWRSRPLPGCSHLPDRWV